EEQRRRARGRFLRQLTVKRIEATDARRVDQRNALQQRDRPADLDIAWWDLAGRKLVRGGDPVDQLTEVDRHRRELARVAGARALDLLGQAWRGGCAHAFFFV